VFALRIPDQPEQSFSSLDAIQAYVDSQPGIDPKIKVVMTETGEIDTFMSVSIDLTYQQVPQAFQAAQVRIENRLKQLPKSGFVEEIATFSA
jgi:hypothetical protein